MNTPASLARAAGTANVTRRHKPWTVRSAGTTPQRTQPPRPIALTRRYEVQWLDDQGHIQDFMKIAPAIPIFEEAFSAFSHGVEIATADGQVPVEDLMPGIMIETTAGEHQPLLWIGSITMIPGAPATGDEPQRLYRVTADTFGLGRPGRDVTFGPAARLLNRDPAIRNALGCEAALAPVSAFEDGVGVIALKPVSPVRVYHLSLPSHQVIRAGGLEVETYHPGPDAHYSMSTEMRDVYLDLFPHVDGLQDFGRVLWPRFEAQDGNIEIV